MFHCFYLFLGYTRMFVCRYLFESVSLPVLMGSEKYSECSRGKAARRDRALDRSCRGFCRLCLIWSFAALLGICVSFLGVPWGNTGIFQGSDRSQDTLDLLSDSRYCLGLGWTQCLDLVRFPDVVTLCRSHRCFQASPHRFLNLFRLHQTPRLRPCRQHLLRTYFEAY